MANYVAHYTKRLQFRTKKEDNLRRLVAQGADREELLLVATQLRDARIRELQAKRAQIPPEDKPEFVKQFATLDAQIEAVHSSKPESVLAEFISD